MEGKYRFPFTEGIFLLFGSTGIKENTCACARIYLYLYVMGRYGTRVSCQQSHVTCSVLMSYAKLTLCNFGLNGSTSR